MKYSILDSTDNGDNADLQEVKKALEFIGHTVSKIRLCVDYEMLTSINLSFILDIQNPDRIILTEDINETFKELWEKERWLKTPRVTVEDICQHLRKQFSKN